MTALQRPVNTPAKNQSVRPLSWTRSSKHKEILKTRGNVLNKCSAGSGEFLRKKPICPPPPKTRKNIEETLECSKTPKNIEDTLTCPQFPLCRPRRHPKINPVRPPHGRNHQSMGKHGGHQEMSSIFALQVKDKSRTNPMCAPPSLDGIIQTPKISKTTTNVPNLFNCFAPVGH